MRIIPVLDIRGGVAVHARAGQRALYGPVRSILCDSAEPRELAAAFRDQLGLTDLYVADLDAIAGAAPVGQILADLARTSREVMVDAGVRGPDQAERLLELGVHRVVLGLETIAGPDALQATVRRIGVDRAVFSLDLRAGEPLGTRDAWQHASPIEIARRVLASGIARIIVLDLAHVGTRAGWPTESLCRAIAGESATAELFVGGGVRDVADLRRLQDAGIDGVLLATALHEGRITESLIT
jgi:phosphoribosylformimino-5-aminoimidazole carboxamide ribotide isomerase